ncbi:MAG TPA: LysE family transporter [Thermoplasmata archaeon]|jgi:threonine/homoserine/homoserine lactone efflux protein
MLEFLATVALGVVLGLSLAAPPGPVNALIASHAVTRSWRSGFFVGVGALTADTCFLVISVLAHSLIEGVRVVFPFIALLGASVMVYFAWRATQAWKQVPAVSAPSFEAHVGSYVTGLTVNITSPYALLWWLTAGLALIDQLGAVVLVGFFAGIILWTMAFPYALRAAQQRYARTYRIVLAFSIFCLGAFAAWLAWNALSALL